MRFIAYRRRAFSPTFSFGILIFVIVFANNIKCCEPIVIIFSFFTVAWLWLLGLDIIVVGFICLLDWTCLNAGMRGLNLIWDSVIFTSKFLYRSKQEQKPIEDIVRESNDWSKTWQGMCKEYIRSIWCWVYQAIYKEYIRIIWSSDRRPNLAIEAEAAGELYTGFVRGQIVRYICRSDKKSFMKKKCMKKIFSFTKFFLCIYFFRL